MEEGAASRLSQVSTRANWILSTGLIGMFTTSAPTGVFATSKTKIEQQ